MWGRILHPGQEKQTCGQFQLVAQEQDYSSAPPPISEPAYACDGMAWVTEMCDPNGWVGYYTCGKMGRILRRTAPIPERSPPDPEVHIF